MTSFSQDQTEIGEVVLVDDVASSWWNRSRRRSGSWPGAVGGAVRRCGAVAADSRGQQVKGCSFRSGVIVESLSGQRRHQAVCGFVEAVGPEREVEAQVVL